MNSSTIPAGSATPLPAVPPPLQPDPAPAVLLYGSPGTGKTDSLTTIIEAGLDLFVLGTESRFKESLLDALARRKLDRSRLHTRLVPPLPASFDALIKHAQMVNTMSFDTLSKISNDPSKAAYTQFIEVLKACNDFVDESGKSWGGVTSWGADRAFAIDSLSGLNLMSMDLVTGTKAVKAPGEWQIAMDNLERMLNTLTSATRCLFVLTAHPERETDELTGGTTVQAGALGRKLSPKLGRFFSDLVLSRREGDKFYWSNVTPNYDLKRRNLPFGERLEPSFKPIIEAYKRRLETAP